MSKYPTPYSPVFIPKGTTIRHGIVAPQPEWNTQGGAEQFEIVLESLSEKPPQSWFGKQVLF